MAIFHLTHKFLKRGLGVGGDHGHASAVAKAAYNAGQKIEDDKGSTAYSDYSRKGGILYDEITLPSGTPKWANERGELWRRLEAREDRSTRRKDAILAHNIDIALPHELSLEQNIFLARDYIREQFTRKGCAVDWAVHSPDPRGDSRNIHLHILVPLRKITGETYGLKDRYTKPELSRKVRGLRQSWATLANRHLKRYGHAAQIDDRSLRAQGIKRTPTKHHGQRSKVKRTRLDSIRPLQPRSPTVSTTKTTAPDGTVTIRAAIKSSALSEIGKPDHKPLIPIKPDSKGWPKEAVTDWDAWGHMNTSRFFAKWPELAAPGGRPSP